MRIFKAAAATWTFVILLLLLSFFTYNLYNGLSVASTVRCPVVESGRSAAISGTERNESQNDRLSVPEQPERRFIQSPGPATMFDCVTWKSYPTSRARGGAGDIRPLDFPTAVSSEGEDKRQHSFVNVYNKQAWGGNKTKTREDDPVPYKASGPGSALDHSQGVIAVLHTIIDRLKIDMDKEVITILDLPCGDLQYMAYFLKTRDDIEYTGADIVPALINTHTNTYRGNHRLKFKHLDIVNGTLEESYDVILCRMMLQHLNNIDVMKALYHFSSSGSRYLISTTFSETRKNVELNTGGYRFRTLNLEAPPISLSPPVCSSLEPINGGHYLDMWRLPLTQMV